MPLKELPIPKTLSLLIRDRAARIPNTTLLSFYHSDGNTIEYDSKSLDTLTDITASYYQPLVPPTPSNPEAPSVIGVIGTNSIAFITSLVGLQRLGHTPLLLSTRLSPEQIAHLLKRTECKTLVVASSHRIVAQKTQELLPDVKVVFIIPEETLDMNSQAFIDAQQSEVPKVSNGASGEVPKRAAWILHSSGSTGLPKPIVYPHTSYRFPTKLALGMEMQPTYYGFSTLPLFHTFGIYALVYGFQAGVKTGFVEGSVPITGPHLVEAMAKCEARIMFLVPYVLRLITDTPGGIDRLRECKTVVFGGASLPESFGDGLASKGIVLSSTFGSTELGLAMCSNTISADLWNWLAIEPRHRGSLYFEPRENDLWELCAGRNFRLFASDTARDIDGVYRTRDLWERHPKYPDLYRHHSRADDLLILENGENANPVQLEVVSESAPGVKNAIAFGAGKAYVGMFIAPAGDEMTPEQVVEEVWKRVEPVNRIIPAFARLAKDAIMVVKEGEKQWPRTAKGNVIRTRFYNEFAEEIDAFYHRAEEADAAPTWKPDALEELEDLVSKGVAGILEVDPEKLDKDSDLFIMGVDSLGAISLRRSLMKKVDFGDAKISENVAYEHPTIRKLSVHLWTLLGHHVAGMNENRLQSNLEDMNSFIKRLSTLPPLVPNTQSTESSQGCHVLLTGATGQLGSYVLRDLLALPHITHITCLVRANSPAHALERTLSAPAFLNQSIPSYTKTKITALNCDLTHPFLGLSHEDYTHLAQKVTHVVHVAWSVNFNLSLGSFNPDLLGLHHLLRLSLASGRRSPAHFAFISSVSVALSESVTTMPDSIISLQLDTVPALGYAQSKFVGEHVLSLVAREHNMKVDVIRGGQLVGDTERGAWNEKEAWPAMMSTALSLGVLPEKADEDKGVGLTWIPVDIAGRAVIEIVGLDKEVDESDRPRDGALVCNLVHPKATNWVGTVIPALRKAGLKFETVSGQEWVRRLKEAKDAGKKVGQAGKLVGHFEAQFAQSEDVEPIKIELDSVLKHAPVLQNVDEIGDDMIKKFVEYWKNGLWKELDRAN